MERNFKKFLSRKTTTFLIVIINSKTLGAMGCQRSKFAKLGKIAKLRWPTSVTAKQNSHDKTKQPRQNKKPRQSKNHDNTKNPRQNEKFTAK